MIRIIASDMDGTLLNDKNEVSQENADAIKAAQAAGIEFMVATGRGLSEAKPLFADHDLHPAFITINGAKVYDEQEALKVEAAIPHPLALSITQTLSEANIYYELFTSRGIASDDRARRIQNVADVLVKLNPDTPYKIAVALSAARLELIHITYVDDYAELLTDPAVKIYKVVAFSREGQAKLAGVKKVFDATGELAVTSSAANNLEINSIAAQKGTALEAYASQKGIRMDEVMAIGDNLNDASMIKMAKYGVAMGNAIPEIKKIAWWTTATNRENGVAVAIQHALDENRGH
ncbi:Cof-type HAD-IIB family hydrolase [Lacticaseibacillus mingshuiensis]|uniref:Cof-type HAD-IIB family hydrolase n=1 Tax=Lacticaseibacillus mingshuiensis TaxID=2799574 RepID=UPI0019419C24|nr:Cof-type HAD-IIB family hydrolase [Lacticaseibacillus mingshuiensis]